MVREMGTGIEKRRNEGSGRLKAGSSVKAGVGVAVGVVR